MFLLSERGALEEMDVEKAIVAAARDAEALFVEVK